MEESKIMRDQHFSNRITELEEDLAQLKTSMEIAYDSTFHTYVMKKYKAIINDLIDDSVLLKEDKLIHMDRVYMVFEELFEEIKGI